MKRYLITFLLLPWLGGCLSTSSYFTQTDVVGTWQHKDTGLLSSVQTLTLQEDGAFSYHSTDTIVGLEMSGSWKLKSDLLWLYPDKAQVRGKPEPVSKEWFQGLPSQPLLMADGKIILSLEENRPFKKIR